MSQRQIRIQNDGFGYCTGCNRGEAHEQLIELGHEVMDGRRRGAIYSFYQCGRCGHLWQCQEDVGGGESNQSYRLITRPASEDGIPS